MYQTEEIFRAWPTEPEAARVTRGPKRRKKGVETPLESKARNNHAWGPNLTVPQKVKKRMGEEEEERKGATSGRIGKGNSNHDPMGEVVVFGCVQTGKQLQAAPKAKMTIHRPAENSAKSSCENSKPQCLTNQETNS